MNTTQTSAVVQMIDSLKADVEGFLLKSDSSAEVAPRLLAYRDAIMPNFVPWMTHAWVRCESEIARRACQENLDCEVNDDHPAMLQRYVGQITDIGFEKNAAVVLQRLNPTLRTIAALTQQSAIDGLLIMAALENTSLVFIPEIKRWGQVLGFTDFEYVDKHGEADIEHADEFVKAVEAETDARGISPNDLAQYPTLRYVSDLLQGIFA